MAKQFKELPAEAVLKAVEEHEDILTPAFEKEQERIRAYSCPNCGSSAIMKVDPERPFIEGRPLPVFVPVCPNCDEPITTPSTE